MEKTKTYKVGNDIFDIPENEEAQFLKDVQGAVEVQSFVVGKDTFDIPLNEVSQFQIDVPNAKPLKKKDESVSEAPSISPTRLTAPLTVGQEPDKMKGLLVEKPASIFNGDKYGDIEFGLSKQSKIDAKRKATEDAFGMSGTTANDIVQGFANGVASLPDQVLKGVDFLWSLSPAGMQKRQFEQYKGLPRSKSLIDEVRDTPQYQLYLQGLKEHSDALHADDVTIRESLKNKDYGKALKTASVNMSQSLPLTLSALFGGPVGLAAVGVAAGGEQYDSIKDEDMPEANKLLNSAMYMYSEILTESVTQSYGKMLKGVFAREGKKEGTKLLAKGLNNWMYGGLKKLGLYTAPVGEGLSEGMNGAAQYLSDVAFGIEEFDNEKLKDVIVDNMVVGGLMGSGFTLVGASGSGLRKLSDVTQENAEIKSSLKDKVNAPDEENVVEAPKTINTEVAPKEAEITPIDITKSKLPSLAEINQTEEKYSAEIDEYDRNLAEKIKGRKLTDDEVDDVIVQLIRDGKYKEPNDLYAKRDEPFRRAISGFQNGIKQALNGLDPQGVLSVLGLSREKSPTFILGENLERIGNKIKNKDEGFASEIQRAVGESLADSRGLDFDGIMGESSGFSETQKQSFLNEVSDKTKDVLSVILDINNRISQESFAEITPSPISESNTPTGIKTPESSPVIPEEVQVAESTAKGGVVQNITPGQKIKVGELTLEGEAAEEYLGFVEKYGKEKADDMMGVADTQHNFLDKADFIKETKGKESEIEPGTYVYDNPLEEGIKIRVKAKSKDEANALAYQQYKDTREQQYAESLKPPDNAQEITPPVSPSSPTEVRNVGEQTGEEVYMGDTEKVREEAPQAPEVKTKEQRLASARSVEELRELINDRSYNIYDKDYLKKDAELRKAGLFNSDDVEIKIKKADAKRILDAEEKAKKEAPSGSSFVPFFHAIKKTIESVTPRRKAERTFSGLVQEYLGERRGLSVPVHDAVMSTEGKIRARLYDVKNTAHAAIKDAETAYKVKKLTDAQYEAIQKALETMGTTDESRAESLKNIPIPLHKTIIKLRNDIDAVTEELKTLELIGPSLEVKFDKNKGYYLTRSYKKYTDDNWTWNVIPNAIKEKAVGVLAEYIPQASADELIGTARAMLESSEVADLIAGKGRFAKFNKDILKKRSDFLTDNPEIRELLGENRDPFFNYALSMSKMIEMAERAKLVENIRDMAIKNGWGSERPSNEKNHIAKITGKAFKTTGFYTEKTEEGETVVKTKSQGKVSPLGEFYVTPEMAEIINNYNDAQKINSPLWRLYYKAMNRVKLSKTAYSIKSQVRNVQSNAFNYIANGNWINIIETSKEIASRFKNDNDGFIRELKERTIIDDSARTGEIVDNIRRMSNHLSFLNDINKSASLNIIRKADDIALKLYSGGDDIWKAFRYVSEYLNYKKAYEKTMTPEVAEREAKARASKIMHRTSTYYSMVPKLMQQLRRLPTNGTFISFPYLTARNFIGTMQTAYEDVTNPNTAGIGVSRIIGLSTAVTALTIASSLINKRAGIDDDDLEDLRRFLPEFWQNDIINITKQYGDGVFSYNNASYLDYYNQVTRPVQMLYRKLSVNGVIKDTDITDAIGEFFEPFVSWDILFDRLTNLKSNSDENGSPIYNPSDELQKKLDDQVLYVLEAFEPGTMTDSRRIFKTWRQGGDWKKPLIGVFTGRQSREIDIKKALDFYMIPDIKDRISNDLYIYKKQKRQYDRIVNPVEIDKKRLNDAYGRAVAAVSKTITDATVDYEAAKRQGVTEKDLTELYTKHKLDNDVKNSILGLYDWKIDPETGSITIKIE